MEAAGEAFVFMVRVQYPQICVPITETELDDLLKDIQKVGVYMEQDHSACVTV